MTDKSKANERELRTMVCMGMMSGSNRPSRAIPRYKNLPSPEEKPRVSDKGEQEENGFGGLLTPDDYREIARRRSLRERRRRRGK